jgi:hypothetical protein
MSYSFNVKAATKSEAIKAAEVELHNVVAVQVVHIADRDKALAAVRSFVALLEEPQAGEQVVLSVNGSLGWRDHSRIEAKAFMHASVSVSAHVARSQD